MLEEVWKGPPEPTLFGLNGLFMGIEMLLKLFATFVIW